jgi:hypothetical protein
VVRNMAPRTRGLAVDSAIVEAEKSLTAAQKEIITLRQKKVNVNPPDNSGSKGKGIDPRNWGNVHLSEDEANLEAQQAALNSFNSNNIQFERDDPPHAAVAQSEPEGHGESTARSHRASKTPTVWVPKNTRPLISRPEAQIAPKSFLGVTLNKLGKNTDRIPRVIPQALSPVRTRAQQNRNLRNPPSPDQTNVPERKIVRSVPRNIDAVGV